MHTAKRRGSLPKEYIDDRPRPGLPKTLGQNIIWGLASPRLFAQSSLQNNPPATQALSWGGASPFSANTFSTRENSWHAQKRLLLCSITNPCRRRQISLFDATPHRFSVRSESPNGPYSSNFDSDVVRLTLYRILASIGDFVRASLADKLSGESSSLHFPHNLSKWLTSRSASRSLARLAVSVSRFKHWETEPRRRGGSILKIANPSN